MSLCTVVHEVTALSQLARCAAQTLGLVTVRYFGRLMPLLLGWIQSTDALLQTEALRTLAIVVQNTWPRMATHAPLLWRHLDAAYRAANLCAASSSVPAAAAALAPNHAQMESFCDAGRSLFWCSTALRHDLRVDSSERTFTQAVLAGV